MKVEVFSSSREVSIKVSQYYNVLWAVIYIRNESIYSRIKFLGSLLQMNWEP